MTSVNSGLPAQLLYNIQQRQGFDGLQGKYNGLEGGIVLGAGEPPGEMGLMLEGGKGATPWNLHVSQVRKSNPQLSFRDALKLASSTYTKQPKKEAKRAPKGSALPPPYQGEQRFLPLAKAMSMKGKGKGLVVGAGKWLPLPDGAHMGYKNNGPIGDEYKKALWPKGKKAGPNKRSKKAGLLVGAAYSGSSPAAEYAEMAGSAVPVGGISAGKCAGVGVGGKGATPWNKHVQAVRKANPGMPFGQVSKLASSTYDKLRR